MLKPFPVFKRAPLRVLLVQVPYSKSADDLTEADVRLQWQRNTADSDGLISDVVNTAVLLSTGWNLPPAELLDRQKHISDVRRKVYNLIRFSGTGHTSPYLRELVYVANESHIAIETTLARESRLYRYIKWFPVSNLTLQY